MSFHKSTNQSIDRRSLLSSSVKVTYSGLFTSLLGGGVSLGSTFQSKLNDVKDANKEPHFFLMINIPDGLDTSYLFDARPLAMTEKSLQVNYLSEAPVPFVGTNGGSTLRTSLTEPLMKWSSRFSVINGVVMSPSFDGHDQNMNILLTGNPFGGSSFVPWFNLSDRPIDVVRTGFLFASIDNLDRSIDLNAQTCKGLAENIGVYQGSSAATEAILRRSQRNSSRSSSVGLTSEEIVNALKGIPKLASRLAKVELPEQQEPPQGESDSQRSIRTAKDNTLMLAKMMQQGVIDAGELILDLFLDSHDASSAKRLPVEIKSVVEIISNVFEIFSQEVSPSGRRLLDDTTILIASEFSRTMRQDRVAIDKSGTDHNPLTNTLILAGKGIRGGQVIGASDFVSHDENLSSCHMTLDPSKLKLMGRPFDVNSAQFLNASPAAFDQNLYLQPMSVVNALQDLFGVPSDRRLTFGRNLPVVPSLKVALA